MTKLIKIVACLAILLGKIGEPTALFAQDCEKKLEQILTRQNQFDPETGMYLKYIHWVEQGELKGETLEQEIWGKGERVRYSNPYLDVVYDGTRQLIVMKDQQQIFVSNPKSIEETQQFNTPTPSSILDSLRKSACEIDCSVEGKIRLDFSNGPTKANPYRTIILEYQTSTGKIIEGRYTLFPVGEEIPVTEVYQYLELSNEVASSSIPSDAMGLWVNHNKGKGIYKGFEVIKLN